MKKTKTISPRISEKTSEFLLSLGGTVNGGAEHVLAMIAQMSDEHVPSAFGNPVIGVDYAVKALSTIYRSALADIKGIFSASELSLMLDVMNGLMLTPQIAGQHITGNVTDAIALDGADQKWHIDADVLKEELERLTVIERAALEIWCRAFWETDAHKVEHALEKYITTLMAK